MKNMIVGNLNSCTTAEALSSLFEPLGIVRKIKLKTDNSTGLSRGFAFIEMTEEEVGRAIAALNGKIVDGQTIQLREGRPKLHRGSLARRGALELTSSPHTTGESARTHETHPDCGSAQTAAHRGDTPIGHRNAL